MIKQNIKNLENDSLDEIIRETQLLIGNTIKLHSKHKQLGFEAVVIIQYKVN